MNTNEIVVSVKKQTQYETGKAKQIGSTLTLSNMNIITKLHVQIYRNINEIKRIT